MTQKEKRDNFRRIAEKRTNEILDKLKSLENLENTSFYYYSAEDLERIYKAISNQVESTFLVLRHIKKRGFNL